METPLTTASDDYTIELELGEVTATSSDITVLPAVDKPVLRYECPAAEKYRDATIKAVKSLWYALELGRPATDHPDDVYLVQQRDAYRRFASSVLGYVPLCE